MRGTESRAQLLVIVGMLVFVTYYKSYGAPCGDTFKKPRQHLDRVALLAGRGHCRLARTAAVELALHSTEVNPHSGRHAVDHAADGLTVAFAKAGEGKYLTKSVHFSTAMSAAVALQKVMSV